MANQAPYAADLSIAYPDRELDRLSSFFRPFFLIPIAVIALLLLGGSSEPMALGGFVFLPTMLLLVFRRKYPRWWFDWNLALTGFCARVAAYALLLTDLYPSTDEEQTVTVYLKYPDAAKLNRWLPLVKWFLAIPHYFVLFFLSLAALAAVIFAWFAILFTRRLPEGLFSFVTGVMRWHVRVSAYAFILITDDYPPFSLNS